MRTESAAAIAVLKNSQVSFPDDQNVLDDNNISSEVVFNERTVLWYYNYNTNNNNTNNNNTNDNNTNNNNTNDNNSNWLLLIFLILNRLC